MGSVNSINQSIPENFEAICRESDSKLTYKFLFNSQSSRNKAYL